MFQTKKHLSFSAKPNELNSFKNLLPFFLLISGLFVFGGVAINELYLSKKSEKGEEVFGAHSEANNSPTTSPTPTLVSMTPTFKPSSMPLKKNTPTPTPGVSVIATPTTNQSQNSTTNSTQSSNDNSPSNPEGDTYIDDLDQQIAEIQRKREICEKLYAEVTGSIQALYNSRDMVTQQYTDAIAKSDTDKIGYYQQELAKLQAQINAAYNQNYYSVCP